MSDKMEKMRMKQLKMEQKRQKLEMKRQKVEQKMIEREEREKQRTERREVKEKHQVYKDGRKTEKRRIKKNLEQRMAEEGIMEGSSVSPYGSEITPEERKKVQILRDVGYPDENENFNTLRSKGGDVKKTFKHLFNKYYPEEN